MHIRESKQKLVAAAFIRTKDQTDETLLSDISVDFRPSCDCPSCMENYLRVFLLMCLQIATNSELDFDAVLQDARGSSVSPTYVQ
jgi:hypothetical protein